MFSNHSAKLYQLPAADQKSLAFPNIDVFHSYPFGFTTSRPTSTSLSTKILNDLALRITVATHPASEI